MKQIIIVGAGGFGREVAWLIERINKEQNEWDLLGFVDDNTELMGSKINSYPVLGGINWLNKQNEEIFVICAIGSSRVRKSVISKIMNRKFAILIDPNVILSNEIEIGEGSIVCAGTILTVNIKLGKHSIINLSCTIGHDVVLHDYVTLYPNVKLSGYTILNECDEIGTGSQIIQGVTIGLDTIVGAGSTVIRNLPEHCTAVGSPAKAIKYHEI